MGKPAARQGDSTAHGGVITVGAPTVLIGGMPAARAGDMTSCPMAVPAPTPIPHVGGPITLGSAGVLICGMPAARMGDQAMCPPMGPAPIVAGCFTVLIGETGGGGGGGGAGGPGGGGSGDAGQAGGAATATGDAESSSSGDGGEGDDQADEGHRLDVEITDQGGHPITGVRYQLAGPESMQDRGQLIGGVRKTGVPSGDYEIKIEAITAAQWSSLRHQVGEEITLEVSTAGVDDGAHVLLEIYRRDSNRPDLLVHAIEESVDGDAVSVNWTPEVTEDLLAYQDDCLDKGQYSNPFYLFKVAIGTLKAWSPLMQLRDQLEVVLKDDTGDSLAERALLIAFPNGEIRAAKTDSGGKLKLEDVPCGRFRISADVRG